jgi:hypothetical protein
MMILPSRTATPPDQLSGSYQLVDCVLPAPERTPIAGHGLRPFRQGHERGWYLVNEQGRSFTEGGRLIVWGLFTEAWDNRRIR